MKIGVPWSVKGIRPEARETAKEAARRSGMSLSDWLNSVIVHSAAEQGIEDGDDDSGEEISAVHNRLDELTRKIDQLNRRGPEAYAPPRTRAQYAPAAPASFAAPAAAAPWNANLDHAVAEIAARRRALNGEPAPQAARVPAMPAAVMPLQPAQIVSPLAPHMPLPAQDLSGLEEQLRHITDQIDTLRHPGVEEAINALRGELAEIGHSLSDAMPRQAIDTIERQIQSLTQRVAEGRQAGVDGGALGNIEHGLAEVRDALYHLTPAENLVGFNEAIHGLAQKIDLIVADKDPAALQQLESAINTLRQISTHVASNEAVSQVASDVMMLAEKVDRLAATGAGGDALNNLEHRIAALSDALAARSESGISVPPALETLVKSLSQKIDQLQQSREGDVAFSHLEDRIVKLVEKLDGSDSRLGHLEAIERGLGDLLVQIEEMRAQKGESSSLRAAGGGVDTLKQDIARTQVQIDAVHGTLEQLLDRLATIEQGILGKALQAAAPAHLPPASRLAVRAVPADQPHDVAQGEPFDLPLAAIHEPAPPQQSAPAPQARQFVASPPLAPEPARKPPLRARSSPIDPDQPPDLPLEPGSGPPRFRADPAARIAASEAALGDSAPASQPTDGKSGFIAAARRAAQAALKDKAPRLQLRALAEKPIETRGVSLKQKLSKRIKALLIAASVIAIVIGAVQLGAKYFVVSQEGALGGRADRGFAQNLPVQTDEASASADTIATGSTPSASSTLHLPGMLPPVSPFGVPGAGVSMPTVAMMPPLNLSPKSIASGDVTGSVTQPPRRNQPAGPQPAIAPPATVSSDDVPLGIAGPHLRKAAIAGDPGAAYEIAMRFAEGRGVAANAAESVRWFDRAARQGLAPAQFHLGSLYEKGQGVKKDLDKARQNYLAAASQGNAKAMHNLAVLYAEGLTGKPDFNTAAEWFRKAAAHGVPDSQYNLAVLYARGLGTPKDLAESYKWFALAADQGDKEAVKKRDEVAGRMDAAELSAARELVRNWHAALQPPAAVTVPQPAGGWDSAAPAARKKPAGPITLGAR